MAEHSFQEVMRQRKRMCNEHIKKPSGCEECPLETIRDSSMLQCWRYFCEYYDESEKVVMRWAEENPEPQYMTWAEWLHEQGLMTDVIDGKGGTFLYNLASETIPTETAQKLGLEPKRV